MAHPKKTPDPFSGLYAILDADAAAGAGWSVPDLADAVVKGGARLLQLRAKHTPSGAFLEMARAVVALARPAGALVIINDRADIARLAAADGVHVGQDDLAPEAVRQIVGEAAIIGLSTHAPDQVEAALTAPVDYVAIGPVFGTTTKKTGYDPIGLKRVTSAARACAARGRPLVAIGGITLETAGAVIDAGAAAVAVIGDLLTGNEPEARVRAFVRRLSP